jgi:hypothetical protein
MGFSYQFLLDALTVSANLPSSQYLTAFCFHTETLNLVAFMTVSPRYIVRLTQTPVQWSKTLSDLCETRPELCVWSPRR